MRASSAPIRAQIEYVTYVDTDWDIVDRYTIPENYGLLAVGPSGNGDIEIYNGAAWADIETAAADIIDFPGVNHLQLPGVLWSAGGTNRGSISVVSAADNQDLKVYMVRLVASA